MKKTVCVFCSSRDSVGAMYLEEARRLGEQLVEADFRLLYGGSRTGPMGRLATAGLQKGGEVIGIYPEVEVAFEESFEGLTEIIRVSTMAERKELMIQRSQAFVVFPGGLGTLDELFEVLTHLHIQRVVKSGRNDSERPPVVILNLFNFWDPMLEMLEILTVQGFVDPLNKALYTVVSTVDEAILALQAAGKREFPG